LGEENGNVGADIRGGAKKPIPVNDVTPDAFFIVFPLLCKLH
jgi:hypothetical protein